MRRNISALRRVAALLLCVLLACGAFAGCSQVEEIVSGVAATGEFPVEVNGINIQSRPSRVVVLSPRLAAGGGARGSETRVAGAGAAGGPPAPGGRAAQYGQRLIIHK